MWLPPRPRPSSFTSKPSYERSGYTRITETRGSQTYVYDCIHPHAAYNERECYYLGYLYLVECAVHTDYDYDNGTSEETLSCDWSYAPSTAQSPLAASAGNELVASLARGGWYHMPTKAAPAPAEPTPPPGSDEPGC